MEFDEQVIAGITVEVINIQKVNSFMHNKFDTVCYAPQNVTPKPTTPPCPSSNVNQQATTNRSDSPGVHSDYVYRVAGLTCQTKVK